jgi:hypothetical protein
MQSAQLPTYSLNLNIHDLSTLEFLISEALRHIQHEENIIDAELMYQRIKKLPFETSDLGRSPASSPLEVGQGGNHDCRNTSDCLCLKCFEALGSLGGNQ